MTYGLRVVNSSGRTQLDTSDATANTYITGNATSAYTNMAFPPSGYVVGDLILARPQPNFTGTVPMSKSMRSGKFYGSSAGEGYVYQNTAGIRTALARKQSGNVAKDSDTYGLEVYDPTGATVVFSSNATNFKILAQGTLTHGQVYTFAVGTSGIDFNKVYTVMNSCTEATNPAVFVLPDWNLYQGYIFNSAGIITVKNEVTSQGQQQTHGARFAFMIVYDPN